MCPMRVDHAAIKAYFDAKDADQDKIFADAIGKELLALHRSNPYYRFVFGRAQWCYIPQAIALEIDRTIMNHRGPDPSPRTTTFVHYADTTQGVTFRYLPPGPDHRKWLEWLTEEWSFATPEQRELACRCLAQMAADGNEIPEELKLLVEEGPNGPQA